MTIIHFEDHPEFKPSYTPHEIIKMGAFGGTYFRPIQSGLLGRTFVDCHLEFQEIAALPPHLVTASVYDKNVNYYGVKCGLSLKDWQDKGWIRETDPRGWFQWYCRFYAGRRCYNDERQIRRWINKKNTFTRLKMTNKVKQVLLHWAIAT